MKLGRREREVYKFGPVRAVDVPALERNLVRTIRGMLDRGELRGAPPDFYAAEKRLFGSSAKAATRLSKIGRPPKGLTVGKKAPARGRSGR